MSLMCLARFTLLLGNGKLLVVKMWRRRIYSIIMCSGFCKGHYENMETWQQILFHLFSCLLACQDGAVSGASPSSQPFAFSLCLQVCTTPSCQTTTLKEHKGVQSYEGLFAIPNFSSNFTGPQVGFTCPSMGRAQQQFWWLELQWKWE